MTEALDWLAGRLCHRGGPFREELLLCLRCSGVYAGVLVGALVELARRRRRPGGAELGLALTGFGAMAVVGFGDLYGVMASGPTLKLAVALVFGASAAQLAVLAGAIELEGVEDAPRPPWGRLGLLAGLVGWSAAAAAGQAWALGALGWASRLGLPGALVLVDGALALVLLRGVRGRLPLAALLTAALVAGELALFGWWRS